MRKVATAALVLGLIGLSAAAHSKAGDKAWSQCVWSQAPQSADAWLSMPVPTWQSGYSEANVLLGHRLIALCDASAVDPLKPGKMPNWKAIAAALRRERPKALPATATATAEVMLCRSSVEELTFLYEIVRREAGRESISFQQYYDQIQGQSVKLPQGLRVLPREASLVKRSCQVIGPKGELQTAPAAEERG